MKQEFCQLLVEVMSMYSMGPNLLKLKEMTLGKIKWEDQE